MNNYGFPYSTNHQLVVDMANSCKKTISCLKLVDARVGDLDDLFSKRVHELMMHRAHNISTDW